MSLFQAENPLPPCCVSDSVFLAQELLRWYKSAREVALESIHLKTKVYMSELSGSKEEARPISAFSMLQVSLPYVFLSLLPLLLLAVQLPASQSADAHSPHRHAGLLAPYPPKAPSIPLDGAALGKLSKGLPVLKQINEGSAGGRGIVVQEVHAPVDVIMGRILDYKNYPKMVPNVAACGNYAEHKVNKNEIEIKTRFLLSLLGFKLEYFIRHTYWPAIDTITWTLDYSRASDFDDSVGYWAVVPRDGKKGGEWSRVYYSIDLRVPDWVPGFVINILNNQALTQATAWVKTESEKAFRAQQSAKAKATGASVSTIPNSTRSTTLAPKKQQGAQQKTEATGLWGAFVEEYGDMINEDKLREQEARRAKRKDEKRVGKELQKKKQSGNKSSARGEPDWDDARMLLTTAWMAILFYGIATLWNAEGATTAGSSSKGKGVAPGEEFTDCSEEDD